MSLANAHRLEIPHSLSEKLLAFRKRVWTIKLIEAVAGALIGFFVAFLVTYTLDRFIDTPKGSGSGSSSGRSSAAALVPMALERWVWRNRRLDQVARLLSRKHPSVGDQLLGIIELAESESEQARSMTLVRAAITQVAEVAEKRDFTDAVPAPRHKSKAVVASVVAAIAIALLVLTPIAARNSFARLLAPWKPIPRYTFAALAPLPERMVVAHGEAFPPRLKLAETTEWKPESGEVASPETPPSRPRSRTVNTSSSSPADRTGRPRDPHRRLPGDAPHRADAPSGTERTLRQGDPPRLPGADRSGRAGSPRRLDDAGQGLRSDDHRHRDPRTRLGPGQRPAASARRKDVRQRQRPGHGG